MVIWCCIYAAESGLAVTVSRLLDMGVCINETKFHGSTPLHVAIDHRCALPPNAEQRINEAFHTVQILINAGADIEMSDDGGRTPLHLAAQLADEASIRIPLE